MTLNSATDLNNVDRLYSDAGAKDIFEWIQSPISRQIFEQGNQIISGIYVQAKPVMVALKSLDALAEEFAAWDAASDEALLNFEKENL